jgi:DNA helicase-2/ATP-dependent DNA helicase PcrA
LVRYSPIEIAKLSVEVADRKFGEKKTSLRQLLHEKSTEPPRDLFSPGLHEGLKKASVVIEKLIADVSNITLQSLFENIIREAGVLGIIMKSNEKIGDMQVLTGLFDFVKDETRRNPFLKLQELINIIELMEKEDLVLPLQQVSGSEKGVNLMTVHGSKGLEFEYVFIVGSNASFWEKKRKFSKGYNLGKIIFEMKEEQDDDQELRRLFYVCAHPGRAAFTSFLLQVQTRW